MDNISQMTDINILSAKKLSATKIPLTDIHQGPINNSPALVQIMAWRRSGDKPCSESAMVRLPTHICRPH